MAQTKAPPRDGDATRARMIAATGKLLRARGYHGVGLREILDAAKAPRGSLYFHFPGGKEELAVNAIRTSADNHLRVFSAALDAAPSLATGLDAIAHAMAQDMEASGFRRGCPVAGVALETALGPVVVREACASFLGRMVDALTPRIARERPAQREPAAAARRVVALLEGALLVAKATRDATILRECGAAMGALLGAGEATPAPAEGRDPREAAAP